MREPLWTDLRQQGGPFDIIGDVHGCFEELAALLGQLGYRIDPFEPGAETPIGARHPEGRTAIFVGDLADRGPRNLDCLRLAIGMCAEGSARVVIGNHDLKLGRWLAGRQVQVTHGLDLTVAELAATTEDFRRQLRAFIDGLRSHAWLAGGSLVVAHAGLKEEMHGRGSAEVRQFAMFGETTGEIDEFGLPVRLDWARNYGGRAAVVYGHTPVVEAEWLNNTICIDTGCCFGGKLTALRWPERALVSVPAAATYALPAKPLVAPVSEPGLTAQQAHDRLLRFDDFARRQRIETRFGATILIPEENALAALEVMSRFAIDPRWLIHLPPTMAPCPTSRQGTNLEHPDQALDYFIGQGVTELVAEEKHMGSRALAVVARDADAAHARFGTEDGKAGVVYTRTGRPFFRDEAMEALLVDRIRAAIGAAGLWEELQTDWMLLDAELMPWSAKAQDLLRHQYLPTVAAARASAEAFVAALDQAGPIEGLAALADRARRQHGNAQQMGRTIDFYCWPAERIEEYRFAPFHLLAAEERVFSGQPHDWHMTMLARLAAGDPVLRPTAWRSIRADDAADRANLAQWWSDHTAAGGEGVVLKPAGFTVARGGGLVHQGLVQPAMKVRGHEYLRIIYGPDYDLPENIDRLRSRGFARKCALAEREFKLGLEGLHCFVERQPLARVHACALGVLALESEPVDPRL